MDTNVLSAGALIRGSAPAGLIGWMDRNSGRLYVSAITVAEIEQGIAKVLRLGAAAKAERLADWLDTILHLYGARVLPLDVPTAKVMGRLTDLAAASGHDPGLADLAIAATASVHGFTVLTRNVRHFRPLAVPVHNPFDTLPAA